ncbi:hypothetical protein VTJ04DRAFT_4123 [Mycothermus thermophilus]|uniref:uncharacterized protein n=1 Tax=Humicola insolens TaxID=85995 RepID=UPI00374421C5
MTLLSRSPSQTSEIDERRNLSTQSHVCHQTFLPPATNTYPTAISVLVIFLPGDSRPVSNSPDFPLS